MPNFMRGLLSQLVIFLTIISFLSLEASLLYARQVFNQRYGIIEHEQSTEANEEEMDTAFVVPDVGGPAYHPVPSYPIELLKEQREELNAVVTGFKEAGQDIPQIVSFLRDSNPLQDIVVCLCRNGFDIVEIAFALGEMGYSKEEVKDALPVKIGDWGVKKSIMVGITSGGSSAIYCSTVTPLPVMSSAVVANVSAVNLVQLEDVENVVDLSASISKKSGKTDFKKLSCSDELKRLHDKGKVDINTALLLKEAGYSTSEIAYAYIDMALDWTGDRTVELVNCAAYALAETLGINIQQRPDIDIENLAAEIIYSDILMQGEVWIKDGKIQSSMAAIQKTASSYNIDLNSYQVDKDDFFKTQKEPAIIHLSQGHWVVLKKVYGDMATVISDGKKVQMSVASLKEMFSGNVLIAGSIENGKILSLSESKQIKGSGWGKKFRKWRKKMSRKIKSFMQTKIGRIVTMVVAVVLTVVTAGAFTPLAAGLGPTMSAAITNGAGAFVSTLVTSSASGMKLGKALKTAGVAGITAGISSGIETNLAGESAAAKLTKTPIKEIAVKAARDSAVSVAVDEGLKATGNDNAYSRVAASTIVSGTTAKIDGSSFTKGAATSFANEGVREIGAANDWHDSVSQVLGTTAGSLTDKWMTKTEFESSIIVRESSAKKEETRKARTDTNDLVDNEIETSSLAAYLNINTKDSWQKELDPMLITLITEGKETYLSAVKPAQFVTVDKNNSWFDGDNFVPVIKEGTGTFKDVVNKIKNDFEGHVLTGNPTQKELLLEGGGSIIKRGSKVLLGKLGSKVIGGISEAKNIPKYIENGVKLLYSDQLGEFFKPDKPKVLLRDQMVFKEMVNILEEEFGGIGVDIIDYKFEQNPITSREAKINNLVDRLMGASMTVATFIPATAAVANVLGPAKTMLVRTHAYDDNQTEYKLNVIYEKCSQRNSANLNYRLGECSFNDGGEGFTVIAANTSVYSIHQMQIFRRKETFTKEKYSNYAPK